MKRPNLACDLKKKKIKIFNDPFQLYEYKIVSL